MSGIPTLSRRSFLILSTAALAACNLEDEVLKFTGMTMGTQYNVVALKGGKAVDRAALAAAIDTALAQVNDEMSNWDATSEISRVNAAGTEAVRLSPALADLMENANAVHAASDGRFDVTVGPLIDLWGFGAAGSTTRVPGEEAIAEARALTGQSRVLTLENGTLRKSVAGAEIYLPAIGKGHGVDRVATAVRSFGIENFMVEIGGDLYTAGHNADGTPWHIGIESPVAGARSVYSVVDVSNLGMATSGDYRNYFEADGTRYSHIIDPTTGRPITHNTVSASVLTENAMLADAWSTAMLVLGRDRGLEIAEAQNLAVVFIDRDGAEGYKTTESSRFTALQA